jgi:hypothetical protein
VGGSGIQQMHGGSVGKKMAAPGAGALAIAFAESALPLAEHRV